MHRDSYGLGWDLGTIGPRRFVSRSGGYAGCRAMSLIIPELQLGIVVMSNGDAAVNSYQAAIFNQAIDYWTDAPEAARRGEERLAEYRRIAAEQLALADAGDPRIKTIVPLDTARMRAAVGRYSHPRLGNMRVALAGGKLVLSGGVLRVELLPIGGDKFLLISPVDNGAESLAFERGPGGAVTGFLWDDDRFVRV